MPEMTGSTRKAGRRGAAVRAALGVAVAVPLALAGPQAGLAGTHPGPAGTHVAGTGWVLQTPQAPAGIPGGALNSVSCTAADSCMAVGGTETSNGDVAFGEAWNGTNWTAEPVT